MDHRRTITDSQLEVAKERYLNYESIAQIAKDLGINRISLQNYVNKGWRSERDLLRAELFQDLSSSKKASFVKLTQGALQVLARAMDTLAKRSEPPTMREAKDAASVMEALDKITRLDENKPTDIIASEKPITVIELKKKLQYDPFYQEIEDVKEITDVASDDTNNSIDSSEGANSAQ